MDYPKITDILERGKKSRIFPGIFLLFAHKGAIKYKKAIGYASLVPEKTSLQESAVFDLASLTKTIATTSALMLLVQEKEIGLDDKASRFVPSLERHGKSEITIRHLLTHSAGFPAWRPYYREICKRRDFTPGSIIKRAVYEMVHREPLVSPVGKESRYSDLGFILLGEIIENVSEKSLDKVCREKIFKRLGMDNTFFIPLDEKKHQKNRLFAATEDCPWRKRVITGEVHDDNAYVMGGVSGHAGLFSTGEDVSLFAKELLDILRGEKGFVSQKILREFVTRQNLVKNSTWALGWDTPSRILSTSGKYFSEESIGHTGFTGVSLWIDLKREIVVVLLSNRVHPSRENEVFNRFRPYIHDRGMEELLKEEHD